jgi:uncharacterized protein
VKIKVKEIPREGLEIDESMSTAAIGFNEDELKVAAPLKIRGLVHKTRDVVSAALEVAGEYDFFCVRCLDPVRMARKDDFKIHVDIDATTDLIDLAEEIRQEMLLDISTIVLCKEDCLGLCALCGMNLNKEKCQCEK